MELITVIIRLMKRLFALKGGKATTYCPTPVIGTNYDLNAFKQQIPAKGDNNHRLQNECLSLITGSP
jgi:hypothetical protein